ncbi:primase-helicase family protein [Myroides pelagicus]|uniref:primase-helicase family protein n=1 Tax=Myroides pelagicus TaxID=270914 RepID=UPI002DBFA194|nr:primase-helicase family protein [Myroides pelagicus]MEC4114758.1 primase-helicase family protein [Myroides pelagicus]
MDLDIPYIRVGTSYFKIIEKPLISGDKVKVMTRWNRETIVSDHGKNFLGNIMKLDGFCCIPDHLNYQLIVDNFYNTYNELSASPIQETLTLEQLENNIPNTLNFVQHIFGDQKEFGLDYLKLLFEKPTQTLPILCLVSKERATGKSSFIKWLKAIFGLNMTYIKGDSFNSQFNSDWASMLLVAIDEVFFDKKEITERLKYLSTTDKDKVEAKGKDRQEIEFFAKFILCSNNEDNFIQIDEEEIRFWIRKIRPIKSEDVFFLKKLNAEIPYFLKYLIERDFKSSQKTRMWFTPQQIMTESLMKLINKNKTEVALLELFHECFEKIDDDEILVAPNDILLLLRKTNPRLFISASEIRKILKRWEFQPEDNTKSYQGIELLSHGEIVKVDRRGRYYLIKKFLFYKIFDALMQE